MSAQGTSEKHPRRRVPEFLRWQGWPIELWNIAVAAMVVYVLDARWWWKLLVLISIQAAALYARWVWRAFRSPVQAS